MTRARPATRAFCLSGGGIRSACFNLGAMQALAEHEIDPDLVTAVSGGSYHAAARAMVRGGDWRGAFRVGSPEERHLRASSRYLAPDAPSLLRGMLCIVAGLALNLALLGLWLYVLAVPLGWLLRGTGTLTGLYADPAYHLGRWWLLPAVAAGLVALLFLVSASAASRLHLLLFHRGPDTHGGPPAQDCGASVSETGWSRRLSCGGAQRAMWQVLVLGAAASALLLGAPALLAVWYGAAHDSGPVGRAVADVHRALHAGSVWVGAPALLAALSALVQALLGRLRARPPEGAPLKGAGEGGFGVSDAWTRLPATWRARLQRTALAWSGSVLVVALLAGWALHGMALGAARGPDRGLTGRVLAAAAALLVARAVIDVNRTSLHSLYRDRLAAAYARQVVGDRLVPSGSQRLSTLGGPEVVVCATVNETTPGRLPPGRGGVSFTFSQRETGFACPHEPGAPREVVPTDTYERVVGVRSLTLFDVVAVSGAAVSPVMGSSTRPSVRLLLALANVRLGVWLPRPGHVAQLVRSAQDDAVPGPSLRAALGRGGPYPGGPVRRLREYAWHLCVHSRYTFSLGDTEADEERAGLVRRTANELVWRCLQPGVRLLLREAFGTMSARGRWLYVTDGGHYDNLGLVEAFRQGATEVYAFDAGGEQTTSWSGLGDALALARTEAGDRIEMDRDFDPSTMVRDGKVFQPWTTCGFRAVDGSGRTTRTGTLHFVKLGVWPGAPWDVRAYSARHASFPTDSTLQQLYDGQEFEAYRALGHAAAEGLLAGLTTGPTRTEKGSARRPRQPAVDPGEQPVLDVRRRGRAPHGVGR